MHCWHNNKLYIVFCSFSGTFVVYSTYKFSLMRLPGKNALSAVSLSFGARTDSTGLRKRTHFAMKLPWRGFETRPDAARCYRTSFCRSCGKVWGSSSLLYFFSFYEDKWRRQWGKYYHRNYMVCGKVWFSWKWGGSYMWWSMRLHFSFSWRSGGERKMRICVWGNKEKDSDIDHVRMRWEMRSTPLTNMRHLVEASLFFLQNRVREGDVLHW